MDHVRIHSRDWLMAELEDFAADRDQHGKHERAAGARAAAAKLAAGAPEVFFERVTYRVGDDPDRHTILTGTRAELRRQLNDDGISAVRMASVSLAQEVARALSALEDGAVRVRVRHIVYEVADGA